jgi:hypothetical protein
MVAGLVVAFALIAGPASASAATYFVDSGSPTGGDGTTSSHIGAHRAFNTIQDAVNATAVGGGDTIQVADGTYREQVDIGHPLTILGTSSDGTVIRPPTDAPGGGLIDENDANFPSGGALDDRPIVFVHSTTGSVVVRHVKVAGLGLGQAAFSFYGIAFLGTGGTIDDVKVTDVRNNPVDTTDSGIAIFARNTGAAKTLVVSGSTLDTYQKDGVNVSGAYSPATINGNTITGNGLQNLPQTGVDVGAGTTAIVTANTISAHRCNSLVVCSSDLTDQSKTQAAAVRFTSVAPTSIVGGTGTAGNTISNNDVGVYDGTAVGTTAVSGNTFAGSQYAAVYVNNGAFTATSNAITGSGGPTDIGFAIVSVHTTTPADFTPSATLTGNTIMQAGTGIALLSSGAPAAPPPVLTAHFNRIADNPSSGGNGLTNATTQVAGPGGVDAINNWWGCNAGPGLSPGCDNATNTSTGGIDVNPWLQLRLLAASTQLIGGESTTVTPDMTMNSDGAIPAGNNFAAATDATLAISPFGTLADTTPTFAAGQAPTTLSTTTAQSGTISLTATLDNQVVPASPLQITVLKVGACANSQSGTSGPDSLLGTRAGDSLSGLGGADLIQGFAGRDCLKGGDGSDTLIGGTGKDKLNGGAGNDSIKARDGERDKISCGSGDDHVTADNRDRVSSNCEHVSRS